MGRFKLRKTFRNGGKFVLKLDSLASYNRADSEGPEDEDDSFEDDDHATYGTEYMKKCPQMA